MEKKRERKRTFRDGYAHISFRLTQVQLRQLDRLVRLSGLIYQQDYMEHMCLKNELIVNGNPRVYKALRTEITMLIEELQRITNATEITPESMQAINQISRIALALKTEDITILKDNILTEKELEDSRR